MSSPSTPQPPQSNTDSSGLNVIIPYKNVPALVAYYLGVFSIIPVLGILLGLAAFILGILGLKRAKQHAEARGRVHAWIGILGGGFFFLLWTALLIVTIMAMVSANA